MTRPEMGPAATGVTPRQQRLGAAGRVAAGLLHEFRNVLGTVSNLAFVMEQQAADADKVRELARRLSELTQLRSRVADRLRDFLRQDAARFPDDAVVDLSAAARETVALCTALASSRPGTGAVRLECHAARPLPVRGDGAELRAAIFELVLNALDALPDAGTVVVSTRASDGEAVLEVSDDGAGMAAEMSEQAFDPFVSTRNEPDAGLGLSAAWGIARRHGGELVLGANERGGTTATLKVPLSPADN